MSKFCIFVMGQKIVHLNVLVLLSTPPVSTLLRQSRVFDCRHTILTMATDLQMRLSQQRGCDRRQASVICDNSTKMYIVDCFQCQLLGTIFEDYRESRVCFSPLRFRQDYTLYRERTQYFCNMKGSVIYNK